MTENESDIVVDDAASAEEEKQKLNLTVEVASPSACERHVTVTIPPEDIQRYFDNAYTELMPNANVPGFRPGRAPRKLVENHFRKEAAGQVKGSLLMDTMTQVSEDQEFSAISEPEFDFDAVEIPDEGPLVFEFDIEVRPDFELPKWKGLKLDKLTHEFSGDDVDAHLGKLLERYSTLDPFDGPAELGDFLVVKIKAQFEGEVVAEDTELQARVRPTLYFYDGVVKDFDKLAVGAKEGSEFDAKVVVSEDAETEKLRGKEVDVHFEVLDVKRLTPPEIDDQMLSRFGNFENEGELRDAVKDELERQRGYAERRRIREQITELLTQAANWDLPPDLLRRQSARELERAVMELRASGFSEDQIQSHANLLRQNNAESTARALKEHFILERIAEEENLEASEDDYFREITLIAMQQNESPRSVRSRYEKRGMMDVLRNQIIEGKAISLITEEASFNEVPYEIPTDDAAGVEFALASRPQSEIPDAKHDEGEELKQPTDRS